MTVSGVLFASDLHLSPARPEQAALALQLLTWAAKHASRVYLLGDLVEFWLGDDDPDPLHQQLVTGIRQLTTAGVPVAVATGNRDFLMGERFCTESGATLLDDYTVIDCYGVPTLLTHGDLLCLKDIKYQQFRTYVRAPDNQRQFLAMPLDARRKLASETRTNTQASMLEKDDYIMDVEEDEVARVLREHRAHRIVHGHTHRPAIHAYPDASERVVLGDWYGQGEVLWVTADSRALLPAAALLARA